MATGRTSQMVLEVLALGSSTDGRVSQHVLEVAVPTVTRSPGFAAANGVALSFPGTDTNTDPFSAFVTRRNRLSSLFIPQWGTSVVIHVGASGALNDGGNVGIICIDGTDDHFQNSPANSGNYTLTPTLADGRRSYLVYSYLSGTYRSGLTGSMTYDSTVTTMVGGGVTNHVLEVLVSDGHARVTQGVLEVIVLDNTANAPGGVSTVSHGYAV